VEDYKEIMYGLSNVRLLMNLSDARCCFKPL